jgi:hypothetical protein
MHILKTTGKAFYIVQAVRRPNSWTIVLGVLLLAIHSHFYIFALRFLFLQTHATSYSFSSSVTVLYTVKEKGGKPDRKPYPLPYALRNSYRKLKF